MFIDTPGSAHPRSRGENIREDLSAQHDVGSSPLTRGKRTDRKILSVLSGLIPAHAGKTPRAVTRLRAVSAHPRSRGENVLPRLPSADLAGSSPLTRGKQIGPRVGVVAARLIPAHAGKTLTQNRLSLMTPAHPRSRGENIGSIAADCAARRLIPAHAGKTTRILGNKLGFSAHPRSRGENAASMAG